MTNVSTLSDAPLAMSGVSPEQSFAKVEHNVELPDAPFALPPEILELQKAAPK